MTIEVNEQDLALLYHKAEQKYKASIRDKENEFLKEEIDIPLESIQAIAKDIKFTFTQESAHEYLVEVTLILHAGDKEIGKYISIETETGEMIDDFLIFH